MRSTDIYDFDTYRHTDFFTSHRPEIIIGGISNYIEDKPEKSKLSKKKFSIDITGMPTRME